MKKLMVLAVVLLTLTTTIYAKEKTVNDGKIGKYVTVEIDTTGTKDFDAIEVIQDDIKFFDEPQMVKIPEKNYAIMKTEVTQEVYRYIMKENPSYRRDDNLPVERLSWYDAIMFCNKLSEKKGLTPVYAVDGNTDTGRWNYVPHKGNSINGKVTKNENSDGYRLPTVEEWQYAAKGGQDFRYAGSDSYDEVGWFKDNGGDIIHPVGQKNANGYGLYDMSGNVWEWCEDSYDGNKCYCGGGYSGNNCEISSMVRQNAYVRYIDVGFRVVRSVNE